MSNDFLFYRNISGKWKNSPAIISSTIISYQEYLQKISATIKNLTKIKFKPHEKVAILIEKNESCVILFSALIQIGVIVVPINMTLPKTQIFQMLTAINCYKLFTYKNSNNLAIDSNIEVFKINEFVPDNISHHQSLNLKPIPFEQDCTIIFTSGSSGNPKAVLHTFGNHYFNALGSNENIHFNPRGRWLLSLPLYHVGGLSILFRAIIGGGAVVLPDEKLNLVENIKKYKVTHISLVATQLKQLMENEESTKILQNLKAILVGGSFIPSDLIQKSIKYKLPIFTTYGSTEMASQITTTETIEKSERLFTSGKLLNHRALKIAEDGEILVKGKTLFKGYVENDSIINPFDSDGWYYTGDLGKIDDDGYLTVVGRKDNMFVSGGENIYPEEIEKYLLNMPEIKNAIVIDIPNEIFGARPVAFVKAENYDLINEKSITEFLVNSLPKFKIPDAFFKWPEKQNTFKPNRSDLKKIFKTQILKQII